MQHTIPGPGPEGIPATGADPQPNLFHELGVRAPGESVYADGVDITDTVLPEDWPAFNRWCFYELGWRPWTPPGVEPSWWSITDARESTPPPVELAQRRGIFLSEVARALRTPARR